MPELRTQIVEGGTITVNEKEFATLIQKSSNGFLTANQAENIAAKTTTELKARGKVSKEEFQQIFNTHLQAELLPNGKLNDAMLNAVREVTKTVSPNVVERTPNWVGELLLSADEKTERERNEVLENAASCYAYLAGSSFNWDSPVLTIKEEQAKAERASIRQLIQKVENLKKWITAYKGILETKQKIIDKIANNIAISSGHYFNDLSESRQAEIRAEAKEFFEKGYTEKFEALEKAMPFLDEILTVYQDALKLKQAQQPTEKEVAETTKRLTEMRKSAVKIIAELEKINQAVIHDRPTGERLAKAVFLLQSYGAVEQEFREVNKRFEQFDIHFPVDLPSLPILQNSIKKAMGENPEKERTNILSKFKFGR